MVIPFQDQASIHNSSTCLTYALCNQVDLQEFKKAFQFLEQVDMRMQLIAMDKGFIINDTYSNDLDSLKAALEFQSAQAGKLPKALIISDLLDNKLSNKKLYSTIANWIKDYGISQVITVGNEIKVLESLGIPVKFHAESTAKLPKELIAESIKAHATLIKGARVFGLEQLVKQWHKSSHSTNLEIDLDALKHNLSYFRTLITPKRKLMVMLKAFAYGAGMETLSNLLEFNNVDYAGVAYTNEGVQLRKNGFTRPIMVMNPELETIYKLIDYELEPAIYSLDFIQEFTEILSKKDIKTYPIHLKLETGMHRLGVSQAELEEVLETITQKPSLKVQSIYSHLSIADVRKEDDYTREQIQLFNKLYDISVKKLSYKPIKHLANTSGMTNFPEARYDMCRLGIGLFGYDGNINTILQPVCKFTAKISKINRIKSHESVGYGRRFIATQNEEIAVIPVGYADGLDRKLGNGHGYVLINGKKAPFVGNICMDMSMIQVTNLDAQVGMEVELFGPNLKIEEVAQILDTIPYELLTRVSQRVKRVYHRT
jgi:alanine racemase